jgi:hypothetical protein
MPTTTPSGLGTVNPNWPASSAAAYRRKYGAHRQPRCDKIDAVGDFEMRVARKRSGLIDQHIDDLASSFLKNAGHVHQH